MGDHTGEGGRLDRKLSSCMERTQIKYPLLAVFENQLRGKKARGFTVSP